MSSRHHSRRIPSVRRARGAVPLPATGTAATAAVLLLTVLLASTASFAAGPASAASDPGAKEQMQVVQDVGELWLTISNFGLIGSFRSTPDPELPSARWPGASGHDLLFSAGIWVGGVMLGEHLVSTGQYEVEIMEGGRPEDVIYPTLRGAPGGTRYPWPGADDDGDGLEDEDMLNGFDDDGDGLVDEDFAAASDQEFVCTMSDTAAMTQVLNPDHTPLGIGVVQRTYQWSDPLVDDFVGLDYTIRNLGVATVEDVYIGFFADFDLPAGTGAGDDGAGSWNGTVAASGGELVDVALAYMRDLAAESPLSAFVGIVLCDHTTDPDGLTAPAGVGIRSVQIMRGETAYDAGGDPTNDAERYEMLSTATSDPDSPLDRPDDYRVLLSVGPFPVLAPGQEVVLRLAMVAGDGLEGLKQNAAEAVLVGRGARFNRDGDPATGPDGKEFQVPWLPASEIPTAAAAGTVRVLSREGGTSLAIEASGVALADLAVVRDPTASLAGRRWTAAELRDATEDVHGVHAYLVDDDPGAWPRAYRLLDAAAGAGRELARLTVGPPARGKLRLEASPNPFNPSVIIAFDLDAPRQVDAAVYDLAGRRVATLARGVLDAGRRELVWNGTDDRGRNVPSGGYVARVATRDGVVGRKLQLVR